MSEKFLSRAENAVEAPNEKERAQKLLEMTKKDLETLEATRATFVANIGILDEKIPHDDILQDTVSLSYNVARNSLLAQLDDLDDLQHSLELHQQKLETLLDLN